MPPTSTASSARCWTRGSPNARAASSISIHPIPWSARSVKATSDELAVAEASPALAARLSMLENRDTLRLAMCGSVDDGKSTLLGRLLAEAGMVPEDRLAQMIRDSKTHGTQGGAPDYALLLDGLEAEREQGITIDVAWRYFGTDKRAFIVADTPGHEQYTRNMATGASTADLAVLLVDARTGILEQTRRHATIAALMGIR